MKIPVVIFFLILSGCFLVPIASAGSYTYSVNTTGYSFDLVNSTYMKDWLYYLVITNKTGVWEFPVIGFSGDIMSPFTDSFSTLGGADAGSIVYLILFGVFVLMVWRQSGKVTIPAMICCITGGGWALLFPESAQPWATILLCSALASQLLTFFAKEG